MPSDEDAASASVVPAKSASSTLPSELARLLSSILDEHELSEIAIVSCPIPSPVDPNPFGPFVLFPSDSASDPSFSSADPSRPTYQLAIPQKPLYGIYALACVRFRALRQVSKAERTAEFGKELFDVTRLLLLQNPEHVTALNDRRRLLLESKTDPSSTEGGEWRQRMKQEQAFTELLLGVQQHAKAWTLWHHLRWLLSELCPLETCQAAALPNLGAAEGPMARLPLDVIHSQLALALHCSTIYSRNYYAWRHRLWVILVATSSHPWNVAADVLASERRTTEGFLQRNPKDHTAAHHLVMTVRLQSAVDPAGASEVSTFVNEALDRYPAVETSWLLARGLVLPSTPFSASTSPACRGSILLKARSTLADSVAREGEEQAEEGTLARKEQEERKRAGLLALRAYLWVSWNAKTLPSDIDIEAIRPLLAGPSHGASLAGWSTLLASMYAGDSMPTLAT